MTDETRAQIKREAGAISQHAISFEAGYKQALIDFECDMAEAMKNNPELNVEAWMWSILQKRYRMAAGDRNKSGRATDSVWHYVKKSGDPPFCGNKRAEICTWTIDAVTCLRCLKKMQKELEALKR